LVLFGPETAVLRGEPSSGVGFLEAHGLAVVIDVWFWCASLTENPDRARHLTAAAVHTLLAMCNITLWRIFILCEVLTLGYVSTSLHCLFAILLLVAARYASSAKLTRHRGAPFGSTMWLMANGSRVREWRCT